MPTKSTVGKVLANVCKKWTFKCRQKVYWIAFLVGNLRDAKIFFAPLWTLLCCCRHVGNFCNWSVRKFHTKLIEIPTPRKPHRSALFAPGLYFPASDCFSLAGELFFCKNCFHTCLNVLVNDCQSGGNQSSRKNYRPNSSRTRFSAVFVNVQPFCHLFQRPPNSLMRFLNG